MSFAAHGNWCGPGWSAGQWKDAKDLTEEDKQVEAIDALDQACKHHDIGIAEGDPEANEKFYEEAAAAGYYGLSLAQFVKIGGPPLQNYLRGGEEVNTMLRTRKQKRDAIKQRAKRKAAGHQRDEDSKRVIAENEDDDLEAGLAFVGGVQDQLEEEKQDNDVVEVLTDLNGDFETPQTVPRTRDPTMTREDQPLRGPRDKGSLTNLLNQVDDTMDAETAPALLRSVDSSTQTSGGQRGKKETLVRYNARAELGVFTETRTVYLPLTVYFSINRTRNYRPIPLRFRVDYPHDIFLRNTLVVQEIRSDLVANIRNHGLSNDMAKGGVRGSAITSAGTGGLVSSDPANNLYQLVPFPCTVKGDTPGVNGNSNAPVTNGKSSSGTISHQNCRPAWSKWYCKQYQYAHVMETDWKVTYWSGDANKEFQNIRVYQGHDVQSTGNTDTIPDTQPLGRMDHWPYLQKHNIAQRTNDNPKDKYVISGTWKDSDHHPMSMIANDEEIKTWTKVGEEDFIARENNYREDVVLMHYSHPDSANTPGFVNCRIDLRYKVQFKDVDNGIRWFGLGVGKDLNTKTDTLQTPFCDNTDTGVESNPERVFIQNNAPAQLL